MEELLEIIKLQQKMIDRLYAYIPDKGFYPDKYKSFIEMQNEFNDKLKNFISVNDFVNSSLPELKQNIMLLSELQTNYFRETGKECVGDDLNFTDHYVQWLQDIVIGKTKVREFSLNPVVVRPVCTCPNSEMLVENYGGTPRCKWCGKDMDPNAL